jgi:hypothetical protein
MDVRRADRRTWEMRSVADEVAHTELGSLIALLVSDSMAKNGRGPVLMGAPGKGRVVLCCSFE